MTNMYMVHLVDKYPAAQFPDAFPPLLEHSLEVKQVPLRPVGVFDVQPSFLNVTTENNEITAKNNKGIEEKLGCLVFVLLNIHFLFLLISSAVATRAKVNPHNTPNKTTVSCGFILLNKASTGNANTFYLEKLPARKF